MMLFLLSFWLKLRNATGNEKFIYKKTAQVGGFLILKVE